MTTPITRFSEQSRFLSNFWITNITAESIRYPSVEHAFQAMKTLDDHKRIAISRLPTPGQAKRFGHGLVLRPGWDSMRVITMLGLLRQKFSNPVLQRKLLDTGDVKLVEGNHWGDTFWGVCNGVGENNLGKLLMKVREEIKEGGVVKDG